MMCNRYMMFLSILFCVILRSTLGISQSGISDRILGGNEVDIEEYPYALQLHYMDKLECGGILISDRLALTAGHCICDKYTEYFVVRAGTSTLGEGGQTFNVSEVYFHPDFDMREDNYDAAVLVLSETVSISTAKAIELPANDDTVTEGATIFIAGWGWEVSNNNDEFSTVLRYANLSVLDDETCKNSYSTPAITSVMFCANYTGTELRDFCLGDYGGPGIIDGVLQGIISFGEGCGDGTNGKVFVKIFEIKAWIEEIMEAFS